MGHLFGYLAFVGAVVLVPGPFLLNRLFPQWRISDRWLLPGKLIRDYGVVSSRDGWFFVERETLALCFKKAKLFLVFRHAGFTPLGWGVSYSKIDLKNISVIEKVMADVRQLQKENEDVRKALNRGMSRDNANS